MTYYRDAETKLAGEHAPAGTAAIRSAAAADEADYRRALLYDTP